MTNIKPYEKLNKEYKKTILTRERINKSLKFSREKEIAYEGLFLYSYTLFENYLETLFLGLLKGKIKIKRGAGIKLDNNISFSKTISDEKIKKYILGDRGTYLDWLPYNDNTKKRAKKYFIDGKPFSELDNSYDNIFNEMKLIRNYISHKSINLKKDIIKIHPTFNGRLYPLLNKKHSNGNVFLDYYIIHLNSISGILQKNILNK